MAAPKVRLNATEQILRDELPSPFWTWPLYVKTFGLWAIWRGRHHFMLTNERVILLKGIVSKTEQTVPLSRIQDVNLMRSLLTGGYVAISSAGGGLGIERLGPFTRERAREFADALSQALPRRDDGVSAPATSPAPGWERQWRRRRPGR